MSLGPTVGIWEPPLGPKPILYSYMDPLGIVLRNLASMVRV